MSASLRYDIAREAARYALTLDDATLDALARYVELLGRWGARIRLTAESSAGVVIERHLADAFAAAKLLAPLVADADLRGLPTIDVGSGAGLPGLPLARLLPQLALVSVEATQRKASFQRSAAHELGIEVVVHAERLEALELSGFAVALSRATFAPETWLERARHLLAPGGRAIVFTASVEDLPEPAPGFEQTCEMRHEYTLVDGAPRVIAAYRLKRKTSNGVF